MIRILGIDPGLIFTGWGIIEKHGSNLKYISSGVIKPKTSLEIAERLSTLYRELVEVINKYLPLCAAVEKTFVNKNPASALRLGEARGVILMVPALLGVSVIEYSPNFIKKAVTGSGHASKEQVQRMVKVLIPKANVSTKQKDVTDALAVALCHSAIVR